MKYDANQLVFANPMRKHLKKKTKLPQTLTTTDVAFVIQNTIGWGSGMFIKERIEEVFE